MAKYIGTKIAFLLTVKDGDGAVFDITNYDILFNSTGANSIEKTSATATEINKTDPTNGVAYIYTLPEDNVNEGTQKYYVKITNKSDSTEVYIVARSTYKLETP